MTTTPTPDEQYQAVYDGIRAVAAHCDGAATKDKVGFNGQDTHFGRRIASVPFSEWTEDVKREAARISRTYRGQIETYTGVDVSTLDVVRDASEHTNHAARSTARGYERQGEKANRSAVLLTDGRIRFSWSSKDPDCFGSLLSAVKALPGRRWTGKHNEVDFTPEAVAFIEEFAVATDFDTSKVAAPAPVTTAAAPERKVSRPVNVTLLPNDRVKIVSPYNADLVAEVRGLPGRQWDGGNKWNTADLSGAVLAFAAKFNLVVADDVVAAIENRSEAAKATEETEDMLAVVSRSADPAALPEEFVNRVLAVLA